MARLGRFSITTEYFYVATELAKARRNYVTTEQFYVNIKLARVGRIFVTVEDFYVTTELAMIESSAAHDRVGRAKASAYESLECVVSR